jgi:hypothetical protein
LRPRDRPVLVLHRHHQLLLVQIDSDVIQCRAPCPQGVRGFKDKTILTPVAGGRTMRATLWHGYNITIQISSLPFP